MKKLVVTSPGLLLILAIIAASGIFLLDVFYLQPRTLSQQDAAMRERAQAAQMAVELTLRAEQNRLSAIAAALAGHYDDHTDGCAPATFAGDAARLLTQQERIVLTDTNGHVLTTADGVGLDRALDLPGDLPATTARGLIRRNDHIALFARNPLAGDEPTAPPDYVWVVRSLDEELRQKLCSATGGAVVWVANDNMRGANKSNHRMWLSGNGQIMVACPTRDAEGNSAGFFRIELPVANIYRQGAVVRRSVLAVLILSAGLTLLIITGVHMLITGPVVRLLKRVGQIERGEMATEDLCHNLHGEPRLLAGQLQSAFDRLTQMSQTDQMTGLANRRHFAQVLAITYEQARRYNRRLSLIAMDVDFFKAINDTGGHEAGDRALAALADVLRDCCRGVDLPARLGGDEFCILMPEISATEGAVLAERIRHTIETCPIRVHAAETTLTLSMGVTDLNAGPISSAEDMMKLADRALYAAKQQGRDRIVQAHDLTARSDQPDANEAQHIEHLRGRLAGLDEQFKQTFLSVADRFAETLAERDPRRDSHAKRTRHYVGLIARELELPEQMVHRLEIAATVHDVGLIALPDAVLLAEGPLTADQQALFERHPLLSVRVMEGLDILDQEVPTVRYHHERFDGRGYPEGLKGPDIPLTARILAVADVFDYLTNFSDFRQRFSRADALVELKGLGGTELDPSLVETFCAAADRLGDELIPEITPRRPTPDARWRNPQAAAKPDARTTGW